MLDLDSNHVMHPRLSGERQSQSEGIYGCHMSNSICIQCKSSRRLEVDFSARSMSPGATPFPDSAMALRPDSSAAALRGVNKFIIPNMASARLTFVSFRS